MTHVDPLAEYLKRRKVAAHLMNASLDSLIRRWTKTVDEIADSYAAGLDDYLNDVDLRQLLHEIERDLPDLWTSALKAELGAADRRCRAQLAPRRECLWGQAAAKKHGWSASGNWWYFMEPQHPGDELARDLERRKPG